MSSWKRRITARQQHAWLAQKCDSFFFFFSSRTLERPKALDAFNGWIKFNWFGNKSAPPENCLVGRHCYLWTFSSLIITYMWKGILAKDFWLFSIHTKDISEWNVAEFLFCEIWSQVLVNLISQKFRYLCNPGICFYGISFFWILECWAINNIYFMPEVIILILVNSWDSFNTTTK